MCVCVLVCRCTDWDSEIDSSLLQARRTVDDAGLAGRPPRTETRWLLPSSRTLCSPSAFRPKPPPPRRRRLTTTRATCQESSGSAAPSPSTSSARQVHHSLQLEPETLFLAVNVLDRFLARLTPAAAAEDNDAADAAVAFFFGDGGAAPTVNVSRSLRRFSVTALLVASKYEDNQAKRLWVRSTPAPPQQTMRWADPASLFASC